MGNIELEPIQGRTMTTRKAAATSANLAFTGFLFSILAFTLAEALNAKANAGLRQHVVTASIGVLVSAVALRRCRLTWPGLANPKAQVPGHAAAWNRTDAAAGLLLIVIGSALALLTRTGSLTLFGLGAVCISMTPWSRIPLCRHHFFASCATVLISGACGLVFAVRPTDSLYLVLVTWALSVISCAAVLFAAFAKVTGEGDTQLRREASATPELSVQGIDAE